MKAWFYPRGNNGIGLGVIVWRSGAEIVIGTLMIKLMFYDRKKIVPDNIIMKEG